MSASYVPFTFTHSMAMDNLNKIKEIINCLERYKIIPYIVDPYVDLELANKKFKNRVFSEIPKFKKFNAVILAVQHKEFLEFRKKDWQDLIYKDGVIFDLKGIVPRDIVTKRL